VPRNAHNALYCRRYVTTCAGMTRSGPLNRGDIENENTTINRFPGRADKKRRRNFEKLRAV